MHSTAPQKPKKDLLRHLRQPNFSSFGSLSVQTSAAKVFFVGTLSDSKTSNQPLLCVLPIAICYQKLLQRHSFCFEKVFFCHSVLGASILVGPSVDNPVSDLLAVLPLDNRLYICILLFFYRN